MRKWWRRWRRGGSCLTPFDEFVVYQARTLLRMPAPTAPRYTGVTKGMVPGQERPPRTPPPRGSGR